MRQKTEIKIEKFDNIKLFVYTQAHTCTQNEKANHRQKILATHISNKGLDLKYTKNSLTYQRKRLQKMGKGLETLRENKLVTNCLRPQTV